MNNPFTPNFGQVPIYMAGRSFLLSEMVRALENAPGDPALTSILMGARGSGKTALLSYLATEAEQRGWIAANVSCIEGMLQDIYEQTQRKAAQFVNASSGQRLTSVNIGQVFGVEWENPAIPERNWRSKMTDVIEALNQQGIGLLITVDEVNPKLDEMVQLAAVYQHFVREERKVALFMAGLPYKISALLNNESVSFLRRASQFRLGRIDDEDVSRAFEQTVLLSQKTIDEDALERAVAGIEGNPFMMQLVGFRSWQAAERREAITTPCVDKGIERAARDLKTRVLYATLNELSNRDLDFLAAMLEDASSSELVRIAERMGVTAKYAATYRRRLLEQGVIEERGRSKLGFALPMLRDYLPEYIEENC